MSRNQEFKYGEDTGYVDIHGRDVRVRICEKTGLILVPIDELKNMGFSIYRKSQYNKLLIDDSQFTNEFNLYMLECAQTYMLKNKIAFKENEILESINKCKKLLAEGHAMAEGHTAEPKKETSSAPQFLKNHTVAESSDANISITSLREPSAITMQNLNLHNDRKFKFTGKNSPTSSVHSFNVSNSTEYDQNRRQSYDNKNQRSSRQFEQNSNQSEYQKRQNNTFEYKNQRGPRSFDQNSFMSDNSDESRRQSNSFDNRKPRQSDSFQQNGKNRNNYNNQNQDKFKNQQKREADLLDDDMKKISSIELNKPEHKVLVTYIEKPNVLWVQDVDNADTLVKIDNQIKSEVNKQKVVNRCEFNGIYLGQDEGEWYRCKPIKFKPLTVFFIDYGNTAQVTETDLREVSEELAAFPAQAVRVTFEEEKYKIETFDSITVRVLKRFDKGTYRVDVITEDGAKENTPPTPQPAPKPISQPPIVAKNTTPTYFDRPKPLCTLQDGQRVMVINEIDGKLVLRTKECYAKLKEIEQLIEGVAEEPLPGKAKKGQLVLCKHKDKLHRGQIVALAGDSFEIKLLDYGDKISVNTSSIRNITESLSVEPVTYIISPSINGGKELSEKVKKMIEDMIKDRTKATVMLNAGDFNLKLTDGRLLSEEIESLDAVSDRIMLKDLQWYKPPLGEGIYTLYSFKDSDNVTFVEANVSAEYLEEILISDLADNQPHTPVMGEVCYGLFQEQWSRCVVIRELNGRFEVKFIDFGNLEFLRAEHLRKATDNIKKAPILGVQCRFIGLPPIKNIEQLLEEHVAEGNEYTLIVKKFDDTTDTCEIEAPQLYKQIKAGQ